MVKYETYKWNPNDLRKRLINLTQKMKDLNM